MEAQLFPPGTIPECATPEWYAEREHAPHLDQPLHRPRLELAAELVTEAARNIDRDRGWFVTASDLGAGDGGLLQLLSHTDLICWGYDLQPSNIEAARRRGVDVTLVDVLAGHPTYGDVVVCTEMLEHLVDPHGFVKHLFDNGIPRALVASSPHTETAESHYEYHLWAWDGDGYVAMIEAAGWKVTHLHTTGMFQVVLAVRP